MAKIEENILACCVILGLTPDNRCGTIYAAGKFSGPKNRANEINILEETVVADGLRLFCCVSVVKPSTLQEIVLEWSTADAEVIRPRSGTLF